MRSAEITSNPTTRKLSALAALAFSRETLLREGIVSANTVARTVMPISRVSSFRELDVIVKFASYAAGRACRAADSRTKLTYRDDAKITQDDTKMMIACGVRVSSVRIGRRLEHDLSWVTVVRIADDPRAGGSSVRTLPISHAVRLPALGEMLQRIAGSLPNASRTAQLSELSPELENRNLTSAARGLVDRVKKLVTGATTCALVRQEPSAGSTPTPSTGQKQRTPAGAAAAQYSSAQYLSSIDLYY